MYPGVFRWSCRRPAWAHRTGCRSCDQGGGGCRDVLEGRRQRLDALVVSCEAVDAALHENQAELRVLVFAVLVEMLADGDGLLDEIVEVLGQIRGEPVCLEDAQDLAPGDRVHLRDAEAVAERHANLGGGQAFLGELADVVTDIL